MWERPRIGGRRGTSPASAGSAGSAVHNAPSAAARKAIFIRSSFIQLIIAHQPDDFIGLEGAVDDEHLVEVAAEAVGARALVAQPADPAAEPDRAVGHLRIVCVAGAHEAFA